ncbi:pectinesterase family protein [Cellvibrio fontiphilus]|uniref:Pectinesterase family protein n=1 Tax=Cellvibrio fontiphilus TaxID=1815559 RepID=A0ABV7FBA3_9GAMM
MKIHLLSAVLLSALLAACGGDNKNGSSPASSSPSGNQPSSAAAQTSSQAPASSAQATSSIASPVVGVLVDAFVAGIGYRTQTQSGVTNERGEFNYLPGETVTFFIGALEFPPVPAKQIVTPLDMGQTTNLEVAMVVNIARLLQSLDSDSDPTNGISIDAAAAQAATAVDFNLSIEAFAASTAVVNLVANSGSNTKALVAIEDAITHLRETLTNVGVPVDGSSSSASSVVVIPTSSAPASSAPASSVPASSVPASSSAASSVVVVPASSAPASSAPASSVPASSVPASSSAASSVVVVPVSSAPASSAPASSVPASSVASSPEPSSAASSSSVIAAPSAFDSADGWASVGVNNLGYPGTNGGVTADQAHTYTVTNRNELLAALYTNLTINDDGSFSGTVDTTPKIIYVDGTINMNMNKALVENTEADYVCPIDGNSIKVAYDFNDYVAFYDPNGAWGTAPVSGDLEAARACAANKQKAVIQIKVGSNTTIIGLGDNAKIVRGHIRLSSPYDNIIIRNVHFEDAFDMFPQWDPTDSGGRWNSAYDNISIDGATHVWIDHCTFNDGTNLDKLHPPVFAAPYNLPEMKVQHHDGAIDITKNANYVTLSHNYVHDHDKTHLVGSSDSIAVDNGPQFLKLTMHHNLFKDVTQRLPRVRMGMVHVYNNVYDGQLKPIDSDRNYAFSVGLATGQFGKIYAENNVFNIEASTDQVEATVHNLYSVSFKQDSGTIAACTNAGYSAADCSTLFYASGTLLNGQPVDVMTAAVNYAAGLATPLTLNSAASYWTPESYYSYTLENADGLANTIIAAAGAGKCSDCLNTDKPVQIPASSSAASSSSAPASASSSSAASSEAPIAMNCGADVYFCDDFSAETAAYWNLLPVAGPVGSFDLFTQNSNQMLRYTAGSAGGVLALVKPAAFTGVTSGDYYVEARIRPRNNSTTGNKQLYVIARAQDANNWYGAGFNVQATSTSTRVAIGKMVGGVFTDNIFTRYNTPIEQGTAGGSDGTWYTLRIEFKGSAIVVYLNGAPVISGTDTSFSAAGLIGLYTTNKSFEIDDIKVGNADVKPVQFTVAPSTTTYVAEAGDLPTALTVTAKNSAGETDTFTAESSDTGVVQVSIAGNQVSLTPVGGGSASITLTSGSDPSKTHVINATIAPEFVQPSQTYDLSGRVDPAVNEASAHVDTRLSITFDAPPTLGSSGRIRIYKTSDDSVVDTITLSDNTDTLGFSGQGSYRIVKTSPLSISGNTLTIAPDNSKLAYNTSYYVAIAEGVVTGATLNGSEFVGLGKAAGWSFTTKTAAPATGDVTVDDNGPADFRTVQGAINHVVQTVARDTPATISIKNGDYRELLFLRGKNNLTLQGESRAGVVIHYTNNEGINSGTGASQAAGSPAGGRSVFLVETSDLLKLDQLTLKNDTLIGSGGQAEVIYFNNDSGRLLATNANFISEQDTIQVKGYSWFYRSLIAGNVDFIWGNNRVALFEESEIRSLGDSRGNGSGGYILQARTVTAADKGFVFLNSSLTRGPGPLNHEIADNQTWLARSGGSVSYFDNIVFINTKMDAHIRTAGWNTSPLPNPVIATATSGWREFASMNLAGDTLDVSGRVADSSYQLSLGEVASSYCNRAQIFAAYNNGAGWNPLPGDTTDCVNFGTASSAASSSSSEPSSSAASDSSSSEASSSAESASSEASTSAESSSEASASSSSAHVPTTTTWTPTLAEFSGMLGTLASGNYPFNANPAPFTVSGLNFYSPTSGSLRLHEASGPVYAINYNGTSFKSDVVMVEGTSGQVDPKILNGTGGVTRYVSIPVAPSALPITVKITYSNASGSCVNGQIALVDQNTKAWKVASACGTSNSVMEVTLSDETVTELFILMNRNGDAGGGIRIWQLEVTR